MGTTLDNGTYLPDEGERNCYEGLAGNWVALDNHLGSTNIHVTINDKQAWNGHVADTTIHVTSADKQAWNGHVADTTIHVTSADKQAWDGHVADSVKHVTAKDKSKWDAVTSKANDSDVVHKSGSETVGGKKTFTDDITASKNTSNMAFYLQNLSYDPKTNGQSGVGGKSCNINFLTSTGNSYINISAYGLSERTLLRLTNYYFTDSQNVDYDSVEFSIYENGARSFRPRNTSNCDLGESNKQWKGVYATNYYYGSNSVEFSTKFVTTDTAQTVSGNKTFSSINGVEPSSLSLPSDRSARIDISSYITNLGNGDNNSYTVPANGYIFLRFASINGAICFSQTLGRLTNYAQTFVRYSGDGVLYVFFPVRKNDNFVVQIYTSSTAVVESAYFIPCQGNV